MDFIGHKSSAAIDLWSVCHLLTGMAIGNIISRIKDKTSMFSVSENSHPKWQYTWCIPVLLLAYFWEMAEFTMENGLFGEAVAVWFDGRENWINRLVSDPVFMLIGYYTGCRFKQVIWPARFLLAVWLWIFVFIFPHSMAYL